MTDSAATGRAWTGEPLAGSFVDGAYATVKGRVRTYVLHHQLMAHLPPPPAAVVDVGGGAGHQSVPLAAAGYDVSLLDSSPEMLRRAGERLAALPEDVRARVSLVEGDGHDAVSLLGGRTFDGVLSHGVLGYLDEPGPMVEQLCGLVPPGGVVSVMTGNARTMAVRPALERRWADALASFDRREEVGVLGVPTRADTVEELTDLLGRHGVALEQWYGVWLFVDWLELSGTVLDPTDEEAVTAACRVELEAGHRDPYRGLSRVVHLVGRRPLG